MCVATKVMRLYCLAIVAGLPTLSAAIAEDAWYPVAVDVWSPPFNAGHQHTVQQYVPPERASRPWRICVSIPHLKDDYWLAVNFGLVDEAKRLGLALNLYEAGGYENLATQQSQIAECMAKNNAQALIVGAISADGLNGVIADYSDKGLPVIDLINGINSDKITARVAADFYDMGLAAGKYLRALQADMSKAAKVAWFPGPAGAAWVAAGDKGFRAALNGSALSIVDGGFGDTGLAAQTRLIEAVLDSHSDIDFIAGTAVSAEAAVQVLQKRTLEQRIKVIAYFGPGIYRGIKRDAILAAPSDSQAVLARISVDQAVRALEKQKLVRHLAVTIKMVDLKSLAKFDLNSSIAPVGFRPIFSVAP